MTSTIYDGYPYVHSTRSSKGHGHHGYSHEMDDGQHRELAELLDGLEGAVIVSGYDCPLYQELFDGWRRVERKALADGARARTECLWMRNVYYPNVTADLL